MKVEHVLFAILVGGLVLACFSVSQAVVDTSEIKEVHKKSVLTQEDLQVIDVFMDDAINDLVRTVSFTDVAETRAIILTYQGAQAQYAQQYSESAFKYISEGLQQARTLSDPNHQFKVVTNLLILVDSLKDPRLLDLSVGAIGHENSVVRYWAVRAATDTALWTKLGQNQAGAAQAAGRILAECARVAESSSPEVLHLMSEFAGRYDSPQASELLGRVADARIQHYADWAVRYELADTAILKQLAGKLTSGQSPDPELGRRFGQLYSFVIQRYIKGGQRNILTSVSRNYLVSVIAEVDDKCLSKLLGSRQLALVKAVQESNFDAVQSEHDKVMETLASKLKISYGNNRSQPLPLPDPPAAQP